MPNQDKTGPEGQGAQTGKRQGTCMNNGTNENKEDTMLNRLGKRFGNPSGQKCGAGRGTGASRRGGDGGGGRGRGRR